MKFNSGRVVLVTLCILILMGASLFNRYPLVTSDTGAYIYHGFEKTIPEDRPVIYGIFLRYASMHDTLWYVVIAQNLLLAFVVLDFISIFLRNGRNRSKLFIVAMLALFTGISWYSSQIMPDIFAGIGLLCILNLLLKPDSGIIRKSFYSVLLLFSAISHNSHLLTYTLALLLLGVWLVLNKKSDYSLFSRKKFLLVSAVVLSGWFANPLINKMLTGKAATGGSPSIFLMARLAESGLLKRYFVKHYPPVKHISEISPERKYSILNRENQMVLDVEGPHTNQNAKIHQWNFFGGENQLFQFRKTGDQTYHIIASHSGFPLAASPENPDYIYQSSNPDDPNILNFEIILGENNYFFLYTRKDQVLEADAGNKSNGVSFREKAVNGNKEQQFRIYPSTHPKLAIYQEVIPHSTIAFLWDERSPFYKCGGWNEQTREEYKSVIMEMISKPRYLSWILIDVLQNGLKQLFHNDIGSGLFGYTKETSPFIAIDHKLNQDLNYFITSKQNTSGFGTFESFNDRYNMVLAFAYLALFIFLFSGRINADYRLAIVLVIFAMAMNAMVTGGLANVLDRLQSRIVWLVPLCAILIAWSERRAIIEKLRDVFDIRKQV
ncbi:MAG: hypothetical protein DWQ44_01330 [Bacteroidetes bacterium]|nr:MAG: hypothetical protein DWQ33_00795 [Bacteroidota bacterium]REK04940.1 MAG: hypothetical protein DWQ39_06925 [Bacteroidota bacterium]REK36556.1 MAG: hypothetical protein DWQ44_01330 [Bacteroidota bacterium]REK50922.1 MAG: hypothetical protein DWQ48_02190 [Bacteroidota bacterium]